MKRSKNTEKSKKVLPESCSESSGSVPEKVKIFGFPLTPSFSALISEAAKKAGMSRSNFVRSAIANAISAVDRGEFSSCDDVCRRQGQQTAPKNDVLARAAGARAVRDSKTPGTPENARRLELLSAGYDEDAVGAYIYAKARAEKTAGRPLTPEEDEEFITSAAERAAEAHNQWGAGPPNM